MVLDLRAGNEPARQGGPAAQSGEQRHSGEDRRWMLRATGRVTDAVG
jgi:hypothetical protein